MDDRVRIARPGDAAVLDVFDALADEQRNKPEAAMSRLQHAIGGGDFSYLVEHLGDLTNRMAKRYHAETGGFEYVEPKVRLSLRSLSYLASNPGAFMSNLETNARYFGIPVEKFRHRVDLRRAEYVHAHNQLVVYNKAQYLARLVAMQCGTLVFIQALETLEGLHEMLRPERLFNEKFTTDGDREKARVELDEMFGEDNYLPRKLDDRADEVARRRYDRLCEKAWTEKALEYLPDEEGLPTPYPWRRR